MAKTPEYLRYTPVTEDNRPMSPGALSFSLFVEEGRPELGFIGMPIIIDESDYINGGATIISNFGVYELLGVTAEALSSVDQPKPDLRVRGLNGPEYEEVRHLIDAKFQGGFQGPPNNFRYELRFDTPGQSEVFWQLAGSAMYEYYGHRGVRGEQMSHEDALRETFKPFLQPEQ